MIKSFKNLGSIIKDSLYKGDDKPSSSRIFSYVMMLVIFLIGLSHVAIEIGNGVIMWKQGLVYVPSWQSISIIAMWLAHQLTLLGIYKRAEASLPNLPNMPKDDGMIKS